MSATESQGPPPPVVEGDPVELADGVYVIPDRRVPLVPNVGFVVGSRAVLVVDTAMGPVNGARVSAITGPTRTRGLLPLI